MALFPAELGFKVVRLTMATLDLFAGSDEKFAETEQQPVPSPGIVGIVDGHESLPFRFGYHFPPPFLEHLFYIIGVHVIAPLRIPMSFQFDSS